MKKNLIHDLAGSGDLPLLLPGFAETDIDHKTDADIKAECDLGNDIRLPAFSANSFLHFTTGLNLNSDANNSTQQVCVAFK